MIHTILVSLCVTIRAFLGLSWKIVTWPFKKGWLALKWTGRKIWDQIRPLPDRGSPAWWVESILISFLISAVVSTVVVWAQADIDDTRSHREQFQSDQQSALSRRIDNARFVRERSSRIYQDRIFHEFDLNGMNLNGLILDGADFTGSDLTNSKMNFVSLSVVQQSALLQYAGTDDQGGQDPMQSGKAQKSDGDDAPMLDNGFDIKAPVYNSSLSGAKLCGAQLGAADLREANLSYSNFADVDLTTTEMDGAFLYHADLSRAKLNPRLLKKVGYDSTTKWPSDFPLPAVDAIEAKILSQNFLMFGVVMRILGIKETAACP